MIVKRMMPMRYELYVDSLFLLNFIMNLYLLLLVDRSTLRMASFGRLALGAAVGAACFLLPFLGKGPVLWRLLPALTAGTAGMLGITFPVRGLRMFLKLLERLALYSFGMGGVMLFLIRLLPGIRGLLLSVPGILGMGMIAWLLFRRFRKELCQGDSLCEATLSKDGERVRVTALVDSGNSLIEPISGKPVCVIGKEVYDRLWKGEPCGFRAIPYHSIGKKRGILPGYLLTGLALVVDGLEYRFADVYVAVSSEEISRADSREAESVNMIINPRLFAREKKHSRTGGGMRGHNDTESDDTRKNAIQDDPQGKAASAGQGRDPLYRWSRGAAAAPGDGEGEQGHQRPGDGVR